MGAPLTTQKEKQNWITDPGRRRSMRVLLSVPISVNGKTVQNQDFSEETRTLVVNAHGALISLAAPVVANQTIFVSNNATEETEECRIVYLGNTQAGKAQMGVEFLRSGKLIFHLKTGSCRKTEFWQASGNYKLPPSGSQFNSHATQGQLGLQQNRGPHYIVSQPHSEALL
jgi:hypothetical protein